MASQEIRRKANIGSSTLIVIFIVLCLATFSLLSLGNAKSDSLLSDRITGQTVWAMNFCGSWIPVSGRRWLRPGEET